MNDTNKISDRVEINRGAWAGYRATVVERDGFAIRVRWDHSGGYTWLHRAHVIPLSTD